ncbi:MAG: 50S ribosomal protein L25 [Anaerosomatales bacterium]|nr:50S ribosomal protein L25 [Anaerosomatales bacterium]
MTESAHIQARVRETTGKQNRRLAGSSEIPAVLYGPARDTVSLALDRHEFELMMAHHGAGSTIVSIALEAEKKPVNAVIREVQHSPVKGNILHVDFLAIRMDQKLQATLSFNFVGDSPGVKAGGVLMHSMREVMVEALPADLPDSIDVDISELEMGHAITVADLVAPEGVEITDDPEGVVCSVTVPTLEPTEEELAEEVAEPEVIGEEASEESSEEA